MNNENSHMFYHSNQHPETRKRFSSNQIIWSGGMCNLSNKLGVGVPHSLIVLLLFVNVLVTGANIVVVCD